MLVLAEILAKIDQKLVVQRRAGELDLYYFLFVILSVVVQQVSALKAVYH
jgi:hypothetical protein